jgi:hypothetical protein
MLEEIKNSGLGLLKAIHASKSAAGNDELWEWHQYRMMSDEQMRFVIQSSNPLHMKTNGGYVFC